jgi:hypothetical protein
MGRKREGEACALARAASICRWWGEGGGGMRGVGVGVGGRVGGGGGEGWRGVGRVGGGWGGGGLKALILCAKPQE